ncbi:MAG: patatin-like phospholipase family protein [Alphaproteobacteria bacterium]|nr:patatin-like phospholipase family protein [Alphaproteobacteria bacterium]
MSKGTPSKNKKISIGMQGGGSHGAFTWGILDYILEDGRLDIEGVSGTSAGGMNCLALTQGMAEGGKEGARKSLFRYWKTLSEKSKKIGMAPTPLDNFKGGHGIATNPLFSMMGQITKNMSPYEWNPKNQNMLEDLIKELFNFKKIAAFEELKVFLCATNVRTSKLKIFSGNEITPEAVLASACLPTLFHAVNIEGDDYWDGGFIGNPAIFPLIYNCETPDIMVLLLTPQSRHNTPKTLDEIHFRMTELSLINTLTREMRAIHFISKLIDEGVADKTKIKKINMHLIENPQVFADLDHTSPMNSDWDFMQFLFEKGRETAEKWMAKNYDGIGVRSTADLGRDFV